MGGICGKRSVSPEYEAFTQSRTIEEATLEDVRPEQEEKDIAGRWATKKEINEFHIDAMDQWLLHKNMLMPKSIAGILFRFLDNLLDWRAAWHFFAMGHKRWGFFTIVFTLTAPLAQCLFAKYKGHSGRIASRYLIPLSYQHLANEAATYHFIMRLPQHHVYGKLHTELGEAHNEAMAGLECMFESFPQALIQTRAMLWIYGLKELHDFNLEPVTDVLSDHKLAVLSILFSCFGILSGLYGLLTALQKQSKGQSTKIKGDPAGGLDVNFKNRDIHAHTCRAIGSFLEGDSCTIQQLTVTTNKFGAEGAASLAKALTKTHPTFCCCGTRVSMLRSLMNASNNIGNAGAISLAEALQVNTTLEELFLNVNDIEDLGAIAIAKALASNPATKLKLLLLHDNKIGDAGCKEIAEALRVNKTLETLRLDGNEITDEGSAALAQVLTHNTTLTQLFIANNKLSDAAKGVLNAIAAARPNLEIIVEKHRSSKASA